MEQMRYVRRKNGDIDFIPAGGDVGEGEVIFYTDPTQFEGTWDKGGVTVGENVSPDEEFIPGHVYEHADSELLDGKVGLHDTGALDWETERRKGVSYVGTEAERKKLGYDPEGKLMKDMRIDAESKKRGLKPIWTEPTGKKPAPTGRKCLQCGKDIGHKRPQSKFCCDACRKKYNTYKDRARKKAIKNFKPLRGTEGQIFYLIPNPIIKGVHPGDVKYVDFIPVAWAESWKQTESYVKNIYTNEDEYKKVMAQIERVMPKSDKGREADKDIQKIVVTPGVKTEPYKADLPDKHPNVSGRDISFYAGDKKVPLEEIRAILAKNHKAAALSTIRKEFKCSQAEALRAYELYWDETRRTLV